MIDESRWESHEITIPVETPHWAIRAYRWVVMRYRPHLGWLVFLATFCLAWLPAMALGDNRVEELRRIQASVDLVGPAAVLTTWLLLGWRTPRKRQTIFTALATILLLFLVGLVIVSQALVSWFPTIGILWQTLLSGAWVALFQGVILDWQQLFTRFVLWWQGVQGGGAAHDNLIFATVAGVLFWTVGVLTAWLVRRTERGLIAALPLLWLLGTMILYTTTERGLMIFGLILVVALHLLLDQHRLVRRWQTEGLDYSPDLVFDRMMVIGVVSLALFFIAAILPNLYYRPLVASYYNVISPIDAQLEEWQDRLFPDLTGISRRGGGSAGGLPNAFLLGAGSELGENVVMHVRTNETAYYDELFYEQFDPPGHYMRGATLAVYNGRGWDNPPLLNNEDRDANTTWTAPPEKGRRQLTQSLTLFVNSPVLYAAPEPLEPGVAYEARVRADGDLVALQQRTRNYTIISSIPAVSEAMLAEVPNWDESNPLPDGYALHLELPDTITDRTRELAIELTGDQPTMFAKAKAIEQFLRQYEYDLKVPEPPTDVIDVADYFLFELQRGYCDYYATAFIALARLVGIPARFATGYAVGSWDTSQGAFIVTESEAHSWPEVYFPEYGWIPFEPTAGRPALARVGSSISAGSVSPSAPALPEVEEPTPRQFTWNGQMLFWLLPLGLLLWGLVVLIRRFQQRREDPWAALQRWGQRVGRPLANGETVLEYGRGLADHIVQQQTQTQDVGRFVAREVTALSYDVNRLHYGTTATQGGIDDAIRDRWSRLRAYLRRLSMKKA